MSADFDPLSADFESVSADFDPLSADFDPVSADFDADLSTGTFAGAFCAMHPWGMAWGLGLAEP
ncbi:MAG: hypothetical protein LBP88_07005 [Treponema sp.]|nr:hypothetical protein [Treponema sp.]